MKSRLLRRTILFICAVAPMGEAYAAENPSPLIIASGSLSRVERPGAAPAFPIEQVLELLHESQGFAFIFDSQLVAGKAIGYVDPDKRPVSTLEIELATVDLRLTKIAARTYTITQAPAQSSKKGNIQLVDADDVRAPIDTILVMGAAPAFETTVGSKRIFKIDADELAYLSVTSPAEAIYDLPQSLASFTAANTALLSAAAGINLADLRGLEPKRTLVLMNGRRRTITTGGNGDIAGVDLNSIPEPFLERIEVQSLPGGARFGGAAVAGTINFVTKSNLDGLEAGARFGISERGDSEEVSLHVIGGKNFEGFGNITLGLNVTRTEGLIGADREFSATPYGFALNGQSSSAPEAQFLPGYGGSSTTDRGSFGGVILSDGAFAQLPGGGSYTLGSNGSLAPYAGSLDQLYNWETWQSVILPNDRILGQLSYNADLSRNWRFFLDAHAGVAATDGVLAPLPATQYRGVDPVSGDAVVIPIDNPTLPQTVKDFAQANFGSSVAGVIFNHRYAELGPRRQKVDRRYIDVATGLQFGDEDRTAFSAYYRFARNRVVSSEKDRVDLNKLKIALDPAACSATPGCSLVDFFTAPEISKPALGYITIPKVSRTLAIEEHEAVATVSSPLTLGGDFDANVAAGVEVRRAIFSETDETPPGTAPVGYLGGSNNHGAITSVDGFTEFESPLFRSGAFPGEMDGSLAVRVSQSSLFGAAMNFEAGVDWRPIDGVSLFTRQHIGSRAPEIIELFAIDPTLETFFVDPCGRPPSKQSPVTQANCADSGPLGVYSGFVQTSPLVSASFYGNPDLQPEEVRSAAYGVTVSPTDLSPALPGRLQLTATWLDFDINDAVMQPANVLEACYSSPKFSSPTCQKNPRTGEPGIVRDPVTRQITSYSGVLDNIGHYSWRGLDLEMRYAMHPEWIPFVDSFWLSALHTYTNRVLADYGAGEDTRLDGLIAYPHHRTLLSAGADIGRWTFVAYGNRRGRAVTRISDRPEANIAAAFYLDTTVRFDVTDRAYIQASIQNLTDRTPEITAFNDIGNFAPEFYDPIGRRFSLSARLSF